MPTTDLSLERKRAWLLALDQDAARQHLIDFTIYTWPEFQAGWFHKRLCAIFEKFYFDIKAGKRPRVIVQAPRRHGKTVIASVRFPAWVLGRDPDFEFILAAYGQALPRRNSRHCQRIIRSEQYRDLFPNIEMDVEQVDEWTIKGHRGTYKATSVGGSGAGYGAHAVIVDDFVKNYQEAVSPTIQQRNVEWYRSTIYPTLHPEGGIMIIGTRWAEHDLIGSVLNPGISEIENADIEPFDVHNFSAIAAEDEEFRKAGEPLHPERYPINTLNRIRAAVGKLVWITMYMGHPQPTAGQCYFISDDDQPEDLALKRGEAGVIEPRRCRLQFSDVKRGHTLIDDAAGHWRIWEEPIPGFYYGAGIDVAEGIDRGDGITDEHVIRIWRRGILDTVMDYLHISPLVSIGKVHQPALVASYRSRADARDLALQLAAAHFYYNQFHMSVERSSEGIGLIDLYLMELIDNDLILSDTGMATLDDKQGAKLGVRITQSNRPQMLMGLKAAIRGQEYFNPDKEFFEQARHFLNINGMLRGETRWHDDIVMAEAHAQHCHTKADMQWPRNLKKPLRSRETRAVQNEITGY